MISYFRHAGLVPASSVVRRLRAAMPGHRWTPEQVRGDGVGARGKIPCLLLPLALAACGSAASLTPKPGQSLPVAPRGARATPTAAQLLRPTAQQRPQRSDELLTSSQARRSDEFDLSPGDNQD